MCIVLLAVVLRATSSIMIPFVLALFFTIVITPAVAFIQKRIYNNRTLAYAILLSSLSLLFFSIVYIAGDSITGLLSNSEDYQKKMIEMATKLQLVFNKLGFDPKITEVFEPENLAQLPIFSYLKSTTRAIITGLSDITMIAIFLIFLLKDSEKMTITKVGIGKKISEQIIKYLSTKIITSGVTGILVGLCLYALGIEMAFMFGLLTIVFNFIPTIGSIAATLLPLPIILIQSNNLLFTATAVAIPGLIQFYIGNILEPKLMGKNLDLHPVTILLSLLIWSSIWKIPGMFLATPLTVIIKIIFEENKDTHFIADIMAGRWPFYNGEEV